MGEVSNKLRQLWRRVGGEIADVGNFPRAMRRQFHQRIATGNGGRPHNSWYSKQPNA